MLWLSKCRGRLAIKFKDLSYSVETNGLVVRGTIVFGGVPTGEGFDPAVVASVGNGRVLST